MPCYDSRDGAAYAREDAQHNSPVAEMLCGIVTTLIAEGQTVPNVDGLAAWWVEHQRRDAAKKRAEGKS